MARKPAIRWRSSDYKDLERRVRNFNRKIDRVLAKEPDADRYLPDKLSLPEMRKNIGTRREYNRAMKAMERFSQRGAEKKIVNDLGLELTQWERREISIKMGTINRQRRRLREDYLDTSVFSEGKALGKTRKELPKDELENLYLPKKFDLNKQRPGEAWDMMKESIEKQSMTDYFRERNDRFKLNYMKALHKTMGARAGGLINMLREMDPDEFMETYRQNLDIDSGYMYSEESMDNKVEALQYAWGEFDTEDYEAGDLDE